MNRESPIKKVSKRIGEILVQRGWLAEDDLRHALAQQKSSGVRRIGEILNEMGWLTEEQLSQALATQFQLKYLDLANLPAGWLLWRESFTAQCKRLKILPLRDPEQQAWLVISERTPDETVHLHAEGLFDLSSIHFAVTPSTCQGQVLAEHLAWDEGSDGPATATLTYPAAPDWLRALMDPAPAVPLALPAEARQALGLPDTHAKGSPEQQVKAAKAAAMEVRRRVPTPLLTLPLRRALGGLGGLWGLSPAEIQRSAHISMQGGPSLKVDVRPLPAEPPPSQPVSHKGLPATRPRPRPHEILLTLPWFSVDEGTQGPAWPSPWPPPDLAEQLPVLLRALCRIASSLKTSESSLRWMGCDTAARESLNRLTLRSIGACVEDSRVDDLQELWDGLLGRVRRLEANRVVSQDWTRWQKARCPSLQIEPGGILCLVSVLLDASPAVLNPGLHLDVAQGFSFRIELDAASEAGATRGDAAEGIALKVTVPRE